MTEIQLPPQNLIAEKATLASEMLDPRTIDVVRDVIAPRDFYFDTHATIQKALLKLRESGAAIDAVLLAQQLQSTGDLADIGGVPYLLEIMESVPHAGHAQYYAGIVLACARRRRTISIAQKLMESAYDHGRDLATTSEAAIKAATELAEESPTSRLTPLSAAVGELIDQFDQGVLPAVKVMIPEIDAATGGASPGELIVFGGRPSHGKSLAALQSLECASQNGWPGLMVSEEMSRLVLGSRSLSSITVVPSVDWLRSTDRLRFDVREHFRDRAPILIAEKCSTATGAEQAIATAVRKHGIKIVAVDYAQLLRGAGDTEQERIADVSQRMKAMAMRYDLIVLLLAQLNRGIELRDDPTPTLADLRGSGSLEQDADVVLFGIWPVKFDDKYPDPLEYRVYQAKNRNRGIGSAITKMRINPVRQRLEPFCPETDAERAAREWV